MSHFVLWLMFAGCCELLPPGHLSVRVDLFPVLFVRNRGLCLFFLLNCSPEFLFLELKKKGKNQIKRSFSTFEPRQKSPESVSPTGEPLLACNAVLYILLQLTSL